MPNPTAMDNAQAAQNVEELVEGTVVEERLTKPSLELVRGERRSEVLRPLNADSLVDSFRQYQELLPRLLATSDYQQAGDRRFVKKSGWRKIATAFDLDVQLVADEVDRDENGRALRTKVIARAITPSGRSMDGDGYCSITESRFTSRRADLSKVENDLRATAATRAKNRAIADLVGMGDVSAEEVSSDMSLSYGPEVPADLAAVAGEAIVKLCGGDKDAGIALWKRIRAELEGYMPAAAAIALIAAAKATPCGAAAEAGSSGAPAEPSALAPPQPTEAAPEAEQQDDASRRPSPAQALDRGAGEADRRASAGNPFGKMVCAAAAGQNLDDGQLANLIRACAGSHPVEDDVAGGQLEGLLERMPEAVAEKAVRHLTPMQGPDQVKRAPGTERSLEVDFGELEPPRAA